MITIKQCRDKDGVHYEHDTLTYSDPLDALSHLAKFELGWNGQIVEVSEGRMKVQTRVDSRCLDTSIFEGTMEEMRPLFELAYFYTKAGHEHSDIIVNSAVECTESLPNGIGGVPLILSLMTPFLIGGERLKVAVMLACGVQDEEDIKAGAGARIEDLVAAFQLYEEGLCSFREALAI